MVDLPNNLNLASILPDHNRILPRLHPDLANFSASLPLTWQKALQSPGDLGQAVAAIWQPIRPVARGLAFRLENITLDLALVISDAGQLPPYLLYICQYKQSLHGWLAGTPVEEPEFKAAEQRLGISLPKSYRRFLQIHDGFFETERPEIGVLSLKQAYLISFTDTDAPKEQSIRLLAFSTDRVGQVHAYNLLTSNGKGDCSTGVWDGERLRLGQPKSFWSYLKDFSIHSLR